MHANVLLPATTSALALAFAATLLARFAWRRQPYLLVWSIALIWYALASGSEAVGGSFGWNAGLYRLWYVTGAIGVAAYLGAGTVYLHREPSFGSLVVVCVLVGCIPALATRRVDIGLLGLASATLLTIVLSLRPRWFAHAVFGLLVFWSAIAAVRIFSAPIDLTQLPSSSDDVVTGQGFDAETRALTPGFNIAGALVLLLGALISALYFWRTRDLPDRVLSNVLIALGAFVPSIASGLSRFGITSVFFLGELVGLLCILAGFVLSASRSGSPRRDPAASSGPS